MRCWARVWRTTIAGAGDSRPPPRSLPLLLPSSSAPTSHRSRAGANAIDTCPRIAPSASTPRFPPLLFRRSPTLRSSLHVTLKHEKGGMGGGRARTTRTPACGCSWPRAKQRRLREQGRRRHASAGCPSFLARAVDEQARRPCSLVHTTILERGWGSYASSPSTRTSPPTHRIRR
ncbi:hypothetical protein B0H14DRAFT_2810387 [Mycena olivaceomarginata]|nr:hypothetical protein B0H14DRAFT_2810387 [Mycena olivaceomarginata]